MRLLPDFTTELFLTDGGIETSLIYHGGFDLPLFAAFDLLRSDEGREGLRRYYRRYLAIAAERKAGFILESPTWRASPDWGERLGYDLDALSRVNHEAIGLMGELAREFAGRIAPLVVSGCIGPRGDGYDPGTLMTAPEAAAYHAFQARRFADAGADLLTGITMTNLPEAEGVARAAHTAGLAAVISFTLETDGRLPTGQPLEEAIEALDALGEAAPLHFMINCAHPSHFVSVIETGAPWAGRIRGLRANASRLSHAELDSAEDLDDGDARELGAENAALARALPALTIFGGCCGTDERHVAAIADACGRREPAAASI